MQSTRVIPLRSAAFLIIAVWLAPVHAAIRYVNKNVTAAAPDGTTWAKAYPTLGAALANPATGDEVWVAAADYTSTSTLIVPAGIALYGGFLGNETQRDQRNPHTRPTILEGPSPEVGSVITIQPSAGPDTIVDGFIIQNGYSNFGGGINSGSANPTITHNVIIKNKAGSRGGGIYISGGFYGVISDNVIACNGAGGYGLQDGFGGGIFSESSYGAITNNTIVGNGAVVGGGLCVSGPNGFIANNVITFNYTGVSIGADNNFRNNDVFGNTVSNYTSQGGKMGSNPTGKYGNISADPLFASFPYGDLHIQAASPCSDAGDDSLATPDDVDLDGDSRIQGAHVDIGADESDGRTTMSMPRIFLVSPSGDDANDGRSWARAKKTVGAGIAAATLDGGDVWVAAGTYPEQLVLPPYVYLYGGFNGTETDRDQRDWNANTTVLEGITGHGPRESVVTVLNGHGVSAVDGFFIQDGEGYGERPAGGGVCMMNASPAISNNYITRNIDTGVYCDTGAPLISNNAIVFNSGGYQGGGCLLLQ